MSLLGKIKYYYHLYTNIRNVSEYRENRKYRDVRPLQFTTRPHPVHFTVAFAMYPVFKEVFCMDTYRINSLVQQLPVNATIIDIGANCGFFDVLLLSKLPTARILAFEPLPVNVEIINRTISRNVLLQKQLQLFPEAVTGNTNGQLELYVQASGDNSEIASVYADFDERNTQKITVPSRTLARIIAENNLPVVDLVKMDCEGSEYDILYHTPSEVLQKIKLIALEVHDLDNQQHNLKAITAFLQEAGYTTRYWPLHNACYYVQAKQVETKGSKVPATTRQQPVTNT